MKNIETNTKYIEWLSAEDLHKTSKQWLSELEFIKDEHLFFEDLITAYTLQLAQSDTFADLQELIGAINKSQKLNNALINAAKHHENKLLLLVDAIDQLKEESEYKNEHKELTLKIDDFLKYYKMLKTQLFSIIKTLKKEDKIRHWIERK